MSSSSICVSESRYVIWTNGRTVRGSARAVLQDIQRHAREDSGVRRRTVEDYASTLVNDSPYFFPMGEVPWFLRNRQYDSIFEQALEYLAAMPSSGVRIISQNGR